MKTTSEALRQQCGIAIFAPYFGALPSHFALWKLGVESNAFIDWFLITDQPLTTAELPQNVSVIRMSLNQLRDHFERELGTSIALTSGYKLCDLRPMFSKLLQLLPNGTTSYKYWGHCDIDVVFGRLDRFILPAIAAEKPRIFDLGHLSLYRNTPFINDLFKLDPRWQSILKSERTFGFDEHSGINQTFRSNEVEGTLPTSWRVADIDPKSSEPRLLPPHLNFLPHLVAYRDGETLVFYRLFNKIHTVEVAYIHFQKREVNVSPNGDLRCFAFVGNSAITTCEPFAGSSPRIDFKMGPSLSSAVRTWLRYARQRWMHALLS
jgi:hypothetical protein